MLVGLPSMTLCGCWAEPPPCNMTVSSARSRVRRTERRPPRSAQNFAVPDITDERTMRLQQTIEAAKIISYGCELNSLP